jgi:DNA-binding LacI/PurR family transcriptional regulator
MKARPSIPQSRGANVRAIAEQAGCSPSTVSRVLSGKYGNVRVSEALRARIRAICAEVGYEPNIHASRMFGKRTGIVGLVVPHGDCGLQDENLAAFNNAVYETLSAADCRLLILMLNDRFLERQEHLSLIRRREVDGLIVWGAVGDPAWLDELAAGGMPFVLGVNRVGDYPCVYWDDTLGMAAMVRQCRARGARRFAFVGGSATDVGDRRREGFLAAVDGCDYRIVPGTFALAAGRQAAAALIADLPDAVVCASDRIAMGVMMGLRQAGLHVPRDILVTGADNIELAEFSHPALTTYDQMSGDCGRLSAALLLANLDHATPLTTQVLTPTIHIRDSA